MYSIDPVPDSTRPDVIKHFVSAAYPAGINSTSSRGPRVDFQADGIVSGGRKGLTWRYEASIEQIHWQSKRATGSILRHGSRASFLLALRSLASKSVALPPPVGVFLFSCGCRLPLRPLYIVYPFLSCTNGHSFTTASTFDAVTDVRMSVKSSVESTLPSRIQTLKAILQNAENDDLYHTLARLHLISVLLRCVLRYLL